MRKPPRFKAAFMGYHYAITVVVAGGYALIVHLSSGHQLLGRLALGTRSSLYVSLATTSGVLLGFGITAITVFVGMGSGRGLDFLRGTPGFTYTRAVFMGAIGSFAIATLTFTAMIVLDAGTKPVSWAEVVAAAAMTLVILRTWAIVWLLNKLLDQVLKDAKARFARKKERGPMAA